MVQHIQYWPGQGLSAGTGFLVAERSKLFQRHFSKRFVVKQTPLTGKRFTSSVSAGPYLKGLNKVVPAVFDIKTRGQKTPGYLYCSGPINPGFACYCYGAFFVKRPCFLC
jgi:hypothetical protein